MDAMPRDLTDSDVEMSGICSDSMREDYGVPNNSISGLELTSGVGGTTRPRRRTWMQAVVTSPHEPNHLLKEENLRGIQTSLANEYINHSIRDVHRRVEAILKPREALWRAIFLHCVQPSALLLLLGIGLLTSAMSISPDPYAASESDNSYWYIVELCCCIMVYIFHLILDVSLYVRRTTDVFNKLTALLRKGCNFSGALGGLSGLRDADSCKIISVLRNAEEAKPSLILANHSIAPSSWVSDGIGRYKNRCQLQSSIVMGAHFKEIFLLFEAYFDNPETYPISIDCCVQSQARKLHLHGQIRPGNELGWLPGTWMPIRIEVEVKHRSQSSDSGCGYIEIAATGNQGNISLRNVSVSHVSWRWHSLPAAMTVARQDESPVYDVAMDTGKMRFLVFGEDLLASALLSVFKKPGMKEIPPPKGFEIPEGQVNGSYNFNNGIPATTTQSGNRLNHMGGPMVQTPPPSLRSPMTRVLASPFMGTPCVSPAPSSCIDDHPSPFLSPRDDYRHDGHRRHIRMESENDALHSSIHSGSEACRSSQGSSLDDSEVPEPTSYECKEAPKTPTQLLMFLTQRCMAYLAFILITIMSIVNGVRYSLGLMDSVSWYYIFVSPAVGTALGVLPIGALFVLRLLDCYANACLRSMIEIQDTSLHVAQSRHSDRQRKFRENYSGGRSSTDSSFTCSESEEQSEGDEAAGDIFGETGVGELLFGRYAPNLSGKEPPPASQDESGMSLEALSHPSIDRKMIFRHLFHIITNRTASMPKEWWGGSYDLVHSKNACQVLGSLTVLTCVDKDGILSEVVPLPEKVLVMKRKENEKYEDEEMVDSLRKQSMLLPILRRSREDDSDDSFIEQQMHHHQRQKTSYARKLYHKMAFLTLELCPDSSAENLFQFADPDWKKHLAKLKPLGLTAALHCLQYLEEEVAGVQQPQTNRSHTRRKRYQHTSSHMREQLHFDDTILWGKHLYFLGKEIGFSESMLTASGFKLKKRIHTWRPMEKKKRRKENKTENVFDIDKANNDSTLDSRQQMASLVVVDPDGQWQLLSIGAPQFLLEYTSDYWNGEEVLPLEETDRKELMYRSNEWRRQRDLVTVAFAYRPLPDHYQAFIQEDSSGEAVHILEVADQSRGDTSSDEHSQGEENTQSSDPLRGLPPDIIYQRLQKKQIFLGMVGSRTQPKNMVQETIEAFQKAGIRFIHFNKGNERMTKAFGEKLGLCNTGNDWNCCISLRDDAATDWKNVKARLPVGINAIETHLSTTDNVPLLVPLFCDASPTATKHMISLLQQYDEVVACVGSCLNHTNSLGFQQADLSISLMPTCNTKTMHENRSLTASRLTLFGLPGCPIGKELPQGAYLEKVSTNFLSSLQNLMSLGSLVGLPTAISMTPTEYPLYFILALIKQARLQLHCALNVTEAVISWSLCWGLCFFICSLAMLPEILTITQLVWQLFLLIPVLSFAVYEPFESLLCVRVMKIHPNKNAMDEHWAVFKHLVSLWFIRYLLTSLAIGGVFVWTLIYTTGENIVDLLPPSANVLRRSSFEQDLQYSRHVTMCAATLFFGMHGVGSLSRHLGIKVFQLVKDDSGKTSLQFAQCRRKIGSDHYNPLEFPTCLLHVFLCICLQFGFSCLALSQFSPSPRNLSLPRYLYVYVITYTVLILVLDNYGKGRRKKMYVDNQVWRKINFDTRLGMHSPRGEDRGDEDKAALKVGRKAGSDSKTLWNAVPFYSL